MDSFRSFRVGHVMRLIALMVLVTPTSLAWKVVFLMMADWFDCGALKLFSASRSIKCTTLEYQIPDKILDLITYTVVLAYIIQNKGLQPNVSYLLGGLLAFRAFGVAEFVKTHDESYLIRYPDFFREVVIYLVIVDHFGISLPYYATIGIIGALMMGKYTVEELLHSN